MTIARRHGTCGDRPTKPADVNRTGQEVEHTAHDVTRAVNATAVETESEVRQAALQLRDDVHRQTDAIQLATIPN